MSEWELKKTVEHVFYFCYNHKLSDGNAQCLGGGGQEVCSAWHRHSPTIRESPMAEQTSQSNEGRRQPADPSLLRQMDEICDEFERAWNAGSNPQIDDYAANVPGSMRADLWRELKALQEQLRQRAATQRKQDSGESPMPVTVDQVIQRLASSGLMSEEEVRAFLDSLPEGPRPREGMALARALADAGKLTLFQAGMVYHGKTRTLVMGEYVLLDRLGQGGMGMVFKARHRRMKREVALKILPPSATKTPEMVKRFHREVEVAAQLEHPNIVMAHDAGEAHGVHYLVMQLVEGGDLAGMVKQNGPLPISTAVDCIIQAAQGLEYAHGKGVIHRDIKPNNMLMDEMGTVKLLDMGLARINAAAEGTEETQDELTVTGRVMGTADFMAPEQAQNTRHADERSDIYSLGCTLCYLLTGRSPFRGDGAISKIVAHLNEPIPSLRKRRPEIPKRLDAVFAKMVAKSPGDRQQTMLEVVQDLQRCARKDEATVPIARPAAVGSEQPQDWLAESPSSAMDDPLAWLEPASAESPADGPPPETADLAETAAYRPVKKKPKPKSRHTKRPVPPTDPPKPVFLKPKLIVGGGAAAAVALLLLGIVVLKFKTSVGTLVIEVDQPGAEVSVDDERISITAAEAGKPVEIKVDEGERTLRVSKDGFEVATREFVMKAGGKEAIKVKLVPVAMAGTTKTKLQAAPATTGENYALEFDGETTGVHIPTLDYDGSHPITIEAFVTRQDNGTIVLTNGPMTLLLEDSRWKIMYRTRKPENALYVASSDTPAIAGQLAHVAAVCAQGRLRLYVDGRKSHDEELISGTPHIIQRAVSTLDAKACIALKSNNGFSTASSTRSASPTSPATRRTSLPRNASSPMSTRWPCTTSTRARATCSRTLQATATMGRLWGRSG